jgi:hypothetical protein
MNKFTLIINGTCEAKPQATQLIDKSYNDYYSNFLHLFYPGKQLPYASLIAPEKEKSWCVASLVHIQATHNDAFITKIGSELALTDYQARKLFDSVDMFLQSSGFVCNYHEPSCWLLAHEKVNLIQCPSVHTMQNNSIYPRLCFDKFWSSLFTEIQMLLYNHPVNIERREQGLPDINGLWFWGAGQLTDHMQLNCNCISDDSHIETFCDFAEIKFTPLETVKHIDNKISQLIVINDSSMLPGILKIIQNKHCDFYWNNTAYHHKLSWWKRLGVFLSHDNNQKKTAK